MHAQHVAHLYATSVDEDLGRHALFGFGLYFSDFYHATATGHKKAALAYLDDRAGYCVAVFVRQQAAPNFQILAVGQIGEGAGSRIEAADEVVHLLGGFAPVDTLHAAVQQSSIGGFVIILGLGHNSTGLDFVDNT